MSADKTQYRMHHCGFAKCAPCTMKDYESTEIDAACDYLDKLYEHGKMSLAFADIGAHVGLWSLCMSEWYINRYKAIPAIYALEPDAHNFVQLRRNAQQTLTGIVPIQAAAWHRSTTLFIDSNPNPGRRRVMDQGRQDQPMMRVPAVALDNVAQNEQQRIVDAIKIDVEGAELNVLNGMRRILTDNEHLLVVLEYSIEQLLRYGHTVDQVTGFMQSHGFTPMRDIDKKTVKTITAGELKRVMFVKGDLS